MLYDYNYLTHHATTQTIMMPLISKLGSLTLRSRSATVALVGFMSGLLLMYVALLGRIQPIGTMSPIVSALREFVHTKGIDVEQLEEELLANYRRQNGVNCSTDTANGTCTSGLASMGLASLDRNISWSALQDNRNNAVTEICVKLHYNSNPATWHMTQDVTSSHLLRDHDNIHMDGKHNVLFCSIPKVACSSWRSALALLTNNLPNRDANTLKGVHFTSFMNKIGLPSASALSLSQLQKAVNKYTKIMVVRHPLERLVSAYRDKFRTYNKWTKHFQLRYGRRIVLLYRGNDATVEALKRGHDVTFEEFLTFIVDNVIPEAERINPHWDTYQHLCHPCHVKYDHVIKFETLEEDNSAILKRYFSVSNATEFFPKRNMKSVPSKDIMMQYYSNISKALVSKIYNMFKVDMDMFGYDIPAAILHTL